MPTVLQGNEEATISNLCAGPLPGGPPLQAIKVVDISDICPKWQGRGKVFLKYASVVEGSLVQLDGCGKIHWFYNGLHAMTREEFLQKLTLEASIFGLPVKQLVDIIFEHIPGKE